ncbi:MAG: hypothetical protein H8E84_01405 [Flavobacteriales bacterium]|nr:hypothetical protein [Flavobacteriales bacterium]
MKSQHLKILILLLLVSFIFFFGYKNYKQLSDKTTSPFIIIPRNASLILKINNIEDFSKKLNNSEIWEKCNQANYVKSLQNNIHSLDSIINLFNKSEQKKIKTIYFSTHKSSYNDAAVLFSISTTKKVNIKDFAFTFLQINSNKIVTHTYENEAIFELTLPSTTYYMAEKEGVIFGSKSKVLVQDAIRQFSSKSNLLNNVTFKKLKETTSNNAIANLYYNFNNLIDLSEIYGTKKQKKNIFLNHFSDWAATDIFIKNNSFFANGLLHTNDKDNFLSTLKNQKAGSHDICKVLPHNTSILFEICISNARDFTDKKNIFLQKHNAFYDWEKQKKYLLKKYNFEINKFLGYVDDEIGTFNLSSKSKDDFLQSFSFIKVTDIQQSTIFLSGLISGENKSEHDGFSIYNIAQSNLLAFLFGDIFLVKENAYFVAIEDYLIFGNSPASLEYIIDNYSSNNTLSQSKHFQKFQQQISGKSNLFFYVNPGKSAEKLNNALNKKWKNLYAINEDSLQKFTAFSYQLNVGNPLFLNNIILFYDKDFKQDLKQEWYGQLDSSFAIKPQIISDYRTGKEQVFVQDNSNKIYLFSTSGEKLWEEQIEGKIMGEVSQVDFYKNKKLQIFFNTKEKIYIIDRLGRAVDDFPKTLPSNATSPHAIFDYSKNRNYRIIVAAEDGKLYNFDKKGKEVKGWKFEATNSIVNEKSQHFTKNGKDYILYPDKNKKLVLLARNGSRRVAFNDIAHFTNYPLQISKKGTLYGITNQGKLWIGNVNGNATEIPLPNLTKNSLFIINSIDTKIDKEFIYTNDKTVFVVDENFKLLHSFEVANSIKEISTFKENIIVITDKELYVWKDGEIKEGTPIITDGFAKVGDIDKDGKLNLIISRDAFLYNFEIE